jgi:hypothetical protein
MSCICICKEVIDELANDYSLGNDNYPKDPASMVAMLSNRRGTVSTKKIDAMKDGILTSFGQTNNGPRCKYCTASPGFIPVTGARIGRKVMGSRVLPHSAKVKATHGPTKIVTLEVRAVDPRVGSDPSKVSPVRLV